LNGSSGDGGSDTGAGALGNGHGVGGSVAGGGCGGEWIGGKRGGESEGRGQERRISQLGTQSSPTYHQCVKLRLCFSYYLHILLLVVPCFGVWKDVWIAFSLLARCHMGGSQE